MLEGTHPTDPGIRFAQTQKENRLSSERIKKMKFNIEQLNFRQFKNLFSEQTTEAQKFENVAARLNEATQLTDRFKSNVDVVKSSELPQADQLSRSMPKLSGGNPIGRNIKIDRPKPLPSGGESKINDSQSTQSDLDPLDVLEVQLSEIVKKIRTAENELAAPPNTSLLPLPGAYIADVKGWIFNTDLKVTLSPNTDNQIVLPTNYLRVDTRTTLRSNTKDIVERGRKLYDRISNTFTFTDNVIVDAVILLDFTDIPEVARRYITIRSARIFQDRVLSSPNIHGFQLTDEQQAYIELQDYQAETADFNIFDNYLYQRGVW